MLSDVELGAVGRLCGRRRSGPGPAAAAAWHDAWCANLLPPANLAMTCCRGSAAVLPAALPKPQMPCMRANLPACSPPFCRRHQCVPDRLLDWALAAHLPLVRGNCLLGRRAIQQHFCLAGRARGSALSFPFQPPCPCPIGTPPLQPPTTKLQPVTWPQVLAVQGHCALHAALLHLRQAGHALHVSCSKLVKFVCRFVVEAWASCVWHQLACACMKHCTWSQGWSQGSTSPSPPPSPPPSARMFEYCYAANALSLYHLFFAPQSALLRKVQCLGGHGKRVPCLAGPACLPTRSLGNLPR